MVEKLEFSMQTIFQLANLEKKCFGKDAWSIAALRGEFENEFSHFFAKRIDGEIVGYVCIRIMYEESQICNICVEPNFRRRGYASELLAEVEMYPMNLRLNFTKNAGTQWKAFVKTFTVAAAMPRAMHTQWCCNCRSVRNNKNDAKSGYML